MQAIDCHIKARSGVSLDGLTLAAGEVFALIRVPCRERLDFLRTHLRWNAFIVEEVAAQDIKPEAQAMLASAIAEAAQRSEAADQTAADLRAQVKALREELRQVRSLHPAQVLTTCPPAAIGQLARSIGIDPASIADGAHRLVNALARRRTPVGSVPGLDDPTRAYLVASGLATAEDCIACHVGVFGVILSGGDGVMAAEAVLGLCREALVAVEAGQPDAQAIAKLQEIDGIGPATAAILVREFGLDTVAKLEAALRAPDDRVRLVQSRRIRVNLAQAERWHAQALIMLGASAPALAVEGPETEGEG